MRSRNALRVVALAAGALTSASAQVPVPKDNDNITPVYEGWLPNDDGSFELVFGYMNREWEGDTSIPLGPANTMDPGGDQGQPTNFFPRRIESLSKSIGRRISARKKTAGPSPTRERLKKPKGRPGTNNGSNTP